MEKNTLDPIFHSVNHVHLEPKQTALIKNECLHQDTKDTPDPPLIVI